MLLLTSASRNVMMEALRVAHSKGMLNEIKHSVDILHLTEDEIFNYFIVVLSRTIK